MKSHLPLIAAALLVLPTGASALTVAVSEDFDQSGSAATSSFFSDILVSGDGVFERVDLTSVTGMPGTSPALPVNSGGDKELLYSETTSAPGPSYAFGALSPTYLDSDVGIDATLGFGTTTVGTHTGAVLLRATGDTLFTIDAYAAIINIDADFTEAALRLVRIRDGAISGADIFATSDNFLIDPDMENYRIEFTAIGTSLSASVTRVTTSGESAIDLFDTAGSQFSLAATDSELTSGDVGLQAFARSGNSVAFDDIGISIVPEPSRALLAALGLATLLLRRQRR